MTSRIALILFLSGSVVSACTYTLPTVDTSTPCGNGVLEGEEQCDDGNDIDGDGCDSNCTATSCGNGIVTTGETCDDGNIEPGDGCTASCQVTICGDGIHILGEEECDDGNTVNGDTCDSNCTVPRCGNRVQGPNEVCDDGNTVNGDECNATCTLKGTSTIFVGQPGITGGQDGMGQGALLNGNQYMALFGDKIYIANDQTVRVIDIPSAQVTTIAGVNGEMNYVDAMTGAGARFRDLRGIASDGTTIWVGDVGNHVIRSISTTAPYPVATVAGVPEVNGNLVAIVDGAASAARFDSPRGLTYFNGVVYLVEANAGVLRAFNPTTMTVTTLAGVATVLGTTDGYGAQARFYGPRHTIANGSNLLYISDTTGYKVRSYDLTTTEVKTVAGTAECGYTSGNALTSKLVAPRGLALEGSNLYIVDDDAHAIRQLQLGTTEISTLTGTPPLCMADCSCGANPGGGYAEGGPNTALWSYPYEIVYHAASRSLFVSDGDNFVIRRIQ